MPRRVLITGGSGFVGQWLARALLERGDAVVAGALEGPGALPGGILSEAERAAVRWLALDVTSDESIAAAIRESRPEWVVHLAGIAFPPEANASPARAFDVNALGALRLLTCLASTGWPERVLVVGTADQYGPHPQSDYPLRETAAQLPRSFYGSSKAAQELIALQMWRARNAPVVCTRSFNHSGVGHAESYLLPALVARAVALPARGGVLRIGNATPVRDYLHVADVVHAYLLLLERGTIGEVYNVCSGNGLSVQQLAESVLKRRGIAAEILSDPALSRPSDTPLLVGDNTKLRQATGWKPQHSAEDIIEDLINAASR